MEEHEIVNICIGVYKDKPGVIKKVKKQEPYDMLTVLVTDPESSKYGPELTLFANEVWSYGKGIL